MVLENGRLTATTTKTTTPAPWTRPLSRPGAVLHGQTAIPLAEVPNGLQPGRQPGRVAIDPTRIRLRTGARLEPTEYPGRVVLLMAEGAQIHVTVDIGVLVVVLLDRERYRVQRPAVGDTVSLGFAADALSL